MKKALVIAEKPSVARDIARVLECKQKGEGYLFNDEYIVSWAIGHLVTLSDPEDYKPEWKKWKTEDLPIIPEKLKIKAIDKTRPQLKILYKLIHSREVDRLICATDSGREGELIFRYIYEITKCKKPFKRLWISSMTDTAIRNGFENLKDGSEYDNLYLSAKCRSEADWLVGINASRAFTLKYNALLSIGRVQTPTLGIMVERQKEIDKFVVRDYWEVEADFEKYKGTWFNPKDNDTKIFDKEKAKTIAKEVKGKNATVESVEYEEKRQAPPLLYDLTELQRDCNKKYGYSAQKTLSLAQDLYEKRKMITYPRTDSRYLSDDMIPKLKVILNKINDIEEYKKFTQYPLSLEKLPITKRIIDNSKISDHHAIIPTDTKIKIESLSKDEFNVYDLIIRRFICVFYPNYIYGTTKAVTSVLINSDLEHKFISRGTIIIQKGWTELNKIVEKDKDKKDKKEEEIILEIKEGEVYNTKNAKDVQKKTKPPANYNEASLLSAMENAGRFVEDENYKEQLKESGLGTPATRAATIERLLQVGYVKRKGKNLIPTEKGMKLMDIIPEELKSPITTGRWEKGLSSVAKGRMEDEKFMGSIKRFVNFLVQNAESSDTGIIFSDDENNYSKKGQKKFTSYGKCPNCQGNILENTKSFYCSNWKNGCKFTLWKNSLEQFQINVDGKFVKKILTEGKIKIEGKNPSTNQPLVLEVSIKDKATGGFSVKSIKE